MKKKISLFLSIVVVASLARPIFAQPATETNESAVEKAPSSGAEVSEPSSKEQLEQEVQRLEREEQQKQAAAQERESRSKRETVREETLKDRLAREQQLKDMNALRESSADTTEYTLSPSSVELVVAMDANNFGFRKRNHRMTMMGEFDFLIRGRAMLQYDYRFFEYLSFGLKGGIDWTSMSLWNRLGRESSNAVPKQFSLLGGIASKWRLTEWYMQSSFNLEPSLLFGYMWQTLPTQDSAHWRLRPGIFANIERVYDSGFVFNMGFGVEFPFDFGVENPIRETVEPVFLLGLGLAI